MVERVFVFGSNLAGRHGKGAALFARQKRGAIYGQGEGYQGNSYAIPTKDGNLRTLALDEVRSGVERFKSFALSRPDLAFELTPIGCGLAGFRHSEIAPMFEGFPTNVDLPPEFKDALLGKLIMEAMRDTPHG
jgi:hypothetical protein